MSSSQPLSPPTSADPRTLPACKTHAALFFCNATESRVCHAFSTATLLQMPSSGDLRIPLGDRVNCVAKPPRGLGPPAAKGLDGKRDQAPTREKGCRVAAVLAVSRAGGRRPVRIRSHVEPGAPFRMSDHHVPVDQRVRRRSSKAAIQPGLFNLHFSLRGDPGPGPSRLADCGGADVAGSVPDPSDDIAN